MLFIIIPFSGLTAQYDHNLITVEDFPERYFTGPPEFGVPPGIDPENEYLKLGYLDVTLYGAIPDDGIDDTEKIQKAIFDSFIYSYAVYFPSGTYDISNTLKCMGPSIINGVENRLPELRSAHVLIGATGGSRPVLKLADNCPGFQDRSSVQYSIAGSDPERVTKYLSLKPVITFWRQSPSGGGAVDPELNRGNINFNQTIRGIDIDLGTGNPGAVGIWMLAAEGTTCQDVRIDAHGAFAGLYDLVGSGGSITNVEVHGGDYGVYGYKMRPTPVVTGLKLIDQTVASFYVGDFTPTTFVGFEFKKEEGPFFEFKSGYNPSQGNISLIDGTFELTGGNETSRMIVNANDNKERIIYLKNVFVKGAGTVIHHTTSNRRLKVADHLKWTRIGEYEYNRVFYTPVKLIEGELTNLTTYYNGILGNSDVVVTDEVIPPVDIRTKHFWEEGFASFDHESENILNVMDFGAIPGDNTDDSEAFNRAIDSAQNCTPYKRVFIPRGHYRITNTIVLQPNVEMFGVARHLTILQPYLWAESVETPMITTISDAEATCALANFKIELYYSQNQIYGVEWKAGRQSIVKDVWLYWIANTTPWQQDPNKVLRRFQIRENGGGRWYNHVGMAGSASKNSGSRHVLIEGTSEPLAFYGFHNQYLEVLDGPMSEITDASNVTLYCLKSETVSERFNFPEGQWSTSILIRNSKDITLIGMSGIAQTEAGKGLVEIENSERVTIANMGSWLNNPVYSPSTWYFAKEDYYGSTAGINFSEKVLGLFKSGFTRRNVFVPGDYESLVDAMNAICSDTSVTNGIINVAAGEYLELTHFNADVDRDLTITVNGSGADNTWIYSAPDDGDKSNSRFITGPGSGQGKLSLIFNDISFKNFGYQKSSAEEGGLLKLNNPGTSVSFTNCNFINNSAPGGAVLSQSGLGNQVFFENCYFGNNKTEEATERTSGGLLSIYSGDVQVRNSTFKSNIRDPVPADGMETYFEGNSTCISLSNQFNASGLNLENNIFVDNRTISGDQLHPVIAAYQYNDNSEPVTLAMQSNVMIGNSIGGTTRDIDIWLDNESITISGQNNYVNKIWVGEERLTHLDGFIIDSVIGYTNDTLIFTMEGDLPGILTDEAGVFYVTYDFAVPRSIPTVSTSGIVNITENSASGGGHITDDGGDQITAGGVCWSTSPGPTTLDFQTTDITGTGSFSSLISELSPDTKYFVRAYATNSLGTSYGVELLFRTLVDSTINVVTRVLSPKVYRYGNKLVIENMEPGKEVYIYGIMGNLIFREKSKDTRMETEPGPGIYLIRTSDYMKKLILL